MVHLALLWQRLVVCPNRDGETDFTLVSAGRVLYWRNNSAPLLFSWSLKMSRCSLPLTPPNRPHCISSRLGVSILAPTGQEPQQPASKLPPTLHGFQTLVIAAYLLSCHRWACRTPTSQARSGTTFPSGPGVTGRTTRLQVPACPSRSWASRWISPPLHYLKI